MVESRQREQRITGRHVVLGMFAFGFVMVGALWLYWELYTRPYRPLQNAIAAEFPGSSPRVVGGRARRDDPRSLETLRIIIWIEFDPESDEPQAVRIAQRLAKLARVQHDVSKYELLEIHLLQRIPEQESKHWTRSQPVSDWYDGAGSA